MKKWLCALLALNTLGVLHVVTSDPNIDSIDDLAGRTVYATGQASAPEYVLRYILEQNGLTDSVTVEYVAEHREVTGQHVRLNPRREGKLRVDALIFPGFHQQVVHILL